MNRRLLSLLPKPSTRRTLYLGDVEVSDEYGGDGQLQCHTLYCYLGNGIIWTQRQEAGGSATARTLYAYTDNLGSIVALYDGGGSRAFAASYDAWSRQTVEYDGIGFRRGYTGHEMLPEFGLVNMNGRLYDSALGVFLSPDSYVQAPDNSQNYNRYSYCLNNPLKYTDPSGELFGLDDLFVAFAAYDLACSMMQAKFNGYNIWKAGAFSLLSSAASYGVGKIFGNTASMGHELLRMGAHGVASGTVSALEGGNILSSFLSGAAASGVGSYGEHIIKDRGFRIVATTAMGAFVAWATGGDILQGAMQGMKISLLNHEMHDKDEGIKYSHDKNGNLAGDIPEVEVVAPKHISKEAFGAASIVNTVVGGIGASLKDNSGNSTFGSNYKFYWHTSNQRGFYGNQYVKTTRLTYIGGRIVKVTGPVGLVLNGNKMKNAIFADIHDFNNGYTNGYNTARATGEIVGSWAGAKVGAWGGRKDWRIYRGIF